VANADKGVMSKINLVKPQESTTASEDAAALGVAAEVTKESKVVKETELPVEKNAVATAC
jgi:hypothetical protein